MKEFTKFWNNNKILIYFIGSIILFIILFFIDRKKVYAHYQGMDLSNYKQPKKWIWKGKSENKCKMILEKYFNKPFEKIRPNFLKYKTGNNLELDMYNDELKVACEYNGIQHSKFSPFFHKNYQDFINQQERDNFKKKKCEEMGIKLIIVPHNIIDLESFI